MKVYLLFIVTVFGATQLFAQGHYYDTTLIINKQKFYIQTKDINPDQVTLTSVRNSKTVQIDTLDGGGLSDFKFIDFDKDGNEDILLTYVGNNSTYYLYLFDQQNNVFKFVEGFDRFPEAIQLTANRNYYYSYHRAGCADRNWVSDLFYIDNFKTIHIGNIYGKGCDSDPDDDLQIIKIFKIIDNKEENEKFIEELPYQQQINEFGDKWSFVKMYWEQNYAKFN